MPTSYYLTCLETCRHVWIGTLTTQRPQLVPTLTSYLVSAWSIEARR